MSVGEWCRRRATGAEPRIRCHTREASSENNLPGIVERLSSINLGCDHLTQPRNLRRIGSDVIDRRAHVR
jgi:hypothetical protein